MSKTNFSQLPLSEIDRLAKEHPNNLEILSQLLNEAQRRTDFFATGIQLDIARRIADLERRSRRGNEKQTGRDETHNHKENYIDDAEVAILRRQLFNALEQIADLQRKLSTKEYSAEDEMFRRVGLNKDCPDFVLRAARVAYRKALHPDKHTEGHKKEAHRKFIDAENIFERIFKLRKS